MPEMLYVQHFHEPFQQPIDLGGYPNNIPANASAQQRSELLIYHKVAKQVYDAYKVVLQCLCNQFHEAIHEYYLAKLDNPNISLTNIHPSIIYQYIADRYANINLKNGRGIPKSVQQAHVSYQTICDLYQKMSGVCSRCRQFHNHGRHGTNGGDACSGNRCNVECIPQLEMQPTCRTKLESLEGAIQ